MADGEAFDEGVGLAIFRRLPDAQKKPDGIAQRIDGGVYLGRQAAPAAPDGLPFAVFFLPAPC